MARILALDIGTRKTGVAFADESVGVALPLATLRHDSPEDLLGQVLSLMEERKAERLLVGLPLLPSGMEGTQAKLVREVVGKLEAAGVAVTLLDERYSNPRENRQNDDVYAAWNLLNAFLGKEERGV
ncbi:MAG: Holliday junction resolvase RuvX [Candidatus Peribacteraceae bacterium]|nr:Holliday junction resolvase RuvX [Candidatus Peribacteraceae bacterium]